MVAVPEERDVALTVPVAPTALPADEGAVLAGRGRRAVAVATSPMELLRPESDLARLAECFEQVDLLVALDDLLPAAGDPDGPDADGPDADGGDRERIELLSRMAQLGLDGLRPHRLGLAVPLGPAAEPDLVAALSELVGFDPEPGLYCLAPNPAPADPGRSVLDRAARRIAQVYGVPLLRYRCLELSVVVEDTD